MSLSTLRLGSQESLAGGNRSFSYEEPTRDGSCYAVKVRLAMSVRLLIRHNVTVRCCVALIIPLQRNPDSYYFQLTEHLMLGPLGLGTSRGEDCQAEAVTEVRPRSVQNWGEVEQVRQQQREEGGGGSRRRTGRSDRGQGRRGLGGGSARRRTRATTRRRQDLTGPDTTRIWWRCWRET